MEQTKLTVFNNEEFGEIRTVIIDNKPWFAGKDVAVSLGYKDTSDALKKHVADEDKVSHFVLFVLRCVTRVHLF